MKLRNKKTGEIGELAGVIRLTVYEPNMPLCGNSILGQYNSLAELNEEWEDYKPAEPFIKDEKIRKTIRSWADANDIEPDETVLITKPTFDGRFLDVEYGMLNMSFIYDDESIANKGYTIAELCGEEEE